MGKAMGGKIGEEGKGKGRYDNGDKKREDGN